MKTIWFLAILGIFSAAHASVWESKETWDSTWEAKYSSWIQNDFNEDFFIQGKWAGISTDCADAVYVARLIFSYENKLPFAMKDPTGSSNLISNSMSRYDDNAEESVRLRRFINYVMEMGSTETLPYDTYPVRISPDYVRAGAVWSRVRMTAGNWWQKFVGSGAAEGIAGHAEIVKEVKDTGVIYLMGSTLPSAVRRLILTSSFVFLPTDSSTGLRNWIQPQNLKNPRSQNPGYSLEQFSMGDDGDGRNLDTWVSEVEARLAHRKETKQETLVRTGMDLCSLSRARIEIVSQGIKYSERIGRCMNANEYDDWSTPTRDLRIKMTLDQLLKLSGESDVDGVAQYLDQCPGLEIAPGRILQLRDYLHRVSDNKISSDPNDSLEARWGLVQSSGSHCPNY
jgi:hypothetical protein